ncbi:J domain-containing protein [Ramlibacter sp. MMS24-I3-19]|uniref:J domain-containing protein n=1 Tax=Ramlibacter sp. MMS24-I3-19 TaxID=3416606 RepID=UPI003D04B45D
MSHAPHPTHYEILGVAHDATVEALRTAYRRAAQRHHPDRSHGDAAAQQRMVQINEAYAVLSHPQRRESYDLWVRALAARRAADAALVASRPTRFEATWPWGLVAATLAFAMLTVGTAVYKSTAPAVAAPILSGPH